MRAVRDTFLMLLSDNLVDTTVHNVRFDRDNPAQSLIKDNAVNVEFLNASVGISYTPSTQLVAINICYDDELVAIDKARAVADILFNGECAKKDYTNPSSPVDVGSKLSWDPQLIRFRPINDGTQFRLFCLLQIRHKAL